MLGYFLQIVSGAIIGKWIKMRTGRPTKYNDEILSKAMDYLENHAQYGDLVPSAVGLACALDVNRTTLYRWSEEYDDFCNILDKVNETQERKLLSGGLGGEYNSNIVKLMLGKHGYSDKQQTELVAAVNIHVDKEGFDKL